MSRTTETQAPDIATDVGQLQALSARGRWLAISTVARAGAGHVGGPLSAMDLLVGLYFRTLNVDPENPHRPDRDRFILSKGHASVGLYAVLALRGFLSPGELATFDKPDSRLQGHPDMKLLPSVDMSTGSLGQGLSVGLGMALGARLRGRGYRTWVMLGDGELQEGMVWEAVHTAARYQLDNLVAIVDCNGLQQYGWTRQAGDRGDRRDPWAGFDLRRIFEGFGWHVLDVDGHDFSSILGAYEEASRPGRSRPTVVLARTVKGKGVSFAENTHKWHTGLATDEQLEVAAAELAVNHRTEEVAR